MNQKGHVCRQAGFIPIIFLLGILLASAGIVGGSVFVKNNLLNKTKTVQQVNANKPYEAGNVPNADLSLQQASNSAAKIQLPGRIYSIQKSSSLDWKLQTSAVSYEDVKALTSEINLTGAKIQRVIVSQDQLQILVETHRDIPTGTNIIGTNDGTSFYLISKDGKTTKIDDKKIVKDLSDGDDWYGNVLFSGFSTNSNKLIGYIDMRAVLKGFGPVYSGKTIIFEYDINSTQSKTLLIGKSIDKDHPDLKVSAKPMFYDPDKQILVYKQSIRSRAPLDRPCVTPQCLALGKDSMRAISDNMLGWELNIPLMPDMNSGIT